MSAAELSGMWLRNPRAYAYHALALAAVWETGHLRMTPAHAIGNLHTETEKQVEEVLEHLWTTHEQGGSGSTEFPPAAFEFDPADALAEAKRRGWVSASPLQLTPTGEQRAAGIIRRHRLAERLLFDVIHVDTDTMEAGACELEHSHILSEEATDRVCAFLGHPPTCPHDRPIPRGRCCEKFSHEVQPLVTPLSQSAIGGGYRVVFIASRSHRRMDRLAAFGVVPGALLRLHQRLPTFMIQVGGTDIALEQEVAADIFVVPH